MCCNEAHVTATAVPEVVVVGGLVAATGFAVYVLGGLAAMVAVPVLAIAAIVTLARRQNRSAKPTKTAPAATVTNRARRNPRPALETRPRLLELDAAIRPQRLALEAAPAVDVTDATEFLIPSNAIVLEGKLS